MKGISFMSIRLYNSGLYPTNTDKKDDYFKIESNIFDEDAYPIYNVVEKKVYEFEDIEDNTPDNLNLEFYKNCFHFEIIPGDYAAEEEIGNCGWQEIIKREDLIKVLEHIYTFRGLNSNWWLMDRTLVFNYSSSYSSYDNEYDYEYWYVGILDTKNSVIKTIDLATT
jgi:hypothetical protein